MLSCVMMLSKEGQGCVLILGHGQTLAGSGVVFLDRLTVIWWFCVRVCACVHAGVRVCACACVKKPLFQKECETQECITHQGWLACRCCPKGLHAVRCAQSHAATNIWTTHTHTHSHICAHPRARAHTRPRRTCLHADSALSSSAMSVCCAAAATRPSKRTPSAMARCASSRVTATMRRTPLAMPAHACTRARMSIRLIHACTLRAACMARALFMSWLAGRLCV